jgi:diadenosine tetraphosphatase ApaH/serine/threonine PP2A family protein phosphatase
MLQLPLALISDLHANLEATQAVLADIDRLGIAPIACLGDLVGYGPDPGPVLDLVRDRVGIAVCGNHDQAVVEGLSVFGFNRFAREAIEFTRDALLPQPHRASRATRDRWRYLENLPQVVKEGDASFVHGTLRHPLTEYCFGIREPWWNPDQIDELMPLIDRLCFAGHTHVPVVIDDRKACRYPRGVESAIRLDRSRKYIVNAGSVGQPRDGDPRACYAVFDGESVRYRRVPYDAEATRRKIIAMPMLADRLGDRLLEGR